MLELNQYLSMFIDESKEHLQAMNDNMLSLENSPDDISLVQSIFRSAHTLKGMSATMGFEDLASLTHEMENVLDLVRNHQIQMNAYIFDCLFQSLDALEAMVEDIIQGGTGQSDVKAIVASLKSIVSGDYESGEGAASTGQSAEIEHLLLDEFQQSVLLQSMESGLQVHHIEVTFREDCVLKAARAYMVFDVMDQAGEVVKSIPPVEDIEQEKFECSFAVFHIGEIETDTLKNQIESVSEVEGVNVTLLDQTSLEQMLQQKNGPGAQQGETAKAKTAASGVPVKQEAAQSKRAEKPKASGNAPLAGRTIRVDIEKLDSLMNLFSELLIDRVRLEQLAGEIKRADLLETVEHMSRVSGDLQNIVLNLRMVPVETVFNRFPRMVRDIAKTLDKKIDLQISGEDTEMDRTVIDEIGDPLVHLLRNAVDHGVETVAERVASGKSETGIVKLQAYHSGNHVMIEIQDDGKGINREAILGKAIQNGLVTPEEAAEMPDHAVHQLLFESGFSTAKEISDISGRGVGLDVVKTKIQSLGGHVLVESSPGQGTKFSVQLPLTLSIISAMLVQLGNEKYAIPLSSIVETSLITKEQVHVVQGSQMMHFRGNVIPLISLSKLLDVPDYSEEEEDETEVVIIRKGDKLAALMVDSFIGQQEIVLKTMGSYLTKLFAVSGATILGDGQVALIIDTNTIIK